MPILTIFIVSRNGSLIYDVDARPPALEVEQDFSYPLDLTLAVVDNRVSVVFGGRDRIGVGHVVLAINGKPVVHGSATRLKDGQEVMSIIQDEARYPLSIKFGRPPLTSNEKIILSSTFHSLYAIGSQISPEPRSSGIQTLEATAFRLECFQSVSGYKFVAIASPKQPHLPGFLHKLYELYSDYALKNPFYQLDQPIRCELFDEAVKLQLERFERTGSVAV